VVLQLADALAAGVLAVVLALLLAGPLTILGVRVVAAAVDLLP
jgi:hypothetical protein